MEQKPFPEDPPADLCAEGLLCMTNDALEYNLKTLADEMLSALQEPTSQVFSQFHQQQPSGSSDVNDFRVDDMPLLVYVSDHRLHHLLLELLKRFPALASSRDKEDKTSLHKG